MKMNDVVQAPLSRRGIVTGLAIALAFPALPALARKKRTSKESPAKVFLSSIYEH